MCTSSDDLASELTTGTESKQIEGHGTPIIEKNPLYTM
jgi:hypothetical protein